MDLSLSTETIGDRTIVKVGGEIDVYTAPKLREQLVELVNDGSFHLVVDMEGVDFLDSTGLGVLVGGLKKVRAHDGSLQLICTQDRLLKIFRITGLAKVFVIHDSADGAHGTPDAAIGCAMRRLRHVPRPGSRPPLLTALRPGAR